jgi:hypothetical protein
MDRYPTSTSWIAAMILSAAASMSPGRLACQTPSSPPQQPPTLGEFFRVDRSTGALTPLEHVKTKTVTGPMHKQGFLTPPTQTVEYYFEGIASPVAFKAGEPQQFVIRLMSSGDSSGKEPSAAEAGTHIAMGPLLVQSAVNQRGKSVVGRFLTKTVIPFDIEPLGKPTLGLDPKNPARTAQSLLLTPHVPLAPGKYQIWIMQMGPFHNAIDGSEHSAFDIVAP